MKMILKRSVIFFLLVIFIWIAQTLFLSQAAKTGFNGWDDWGMLTTYEAFNGDDPKSFPAIAKFFGSPYLWSQAYNIGPLKNIFGLHQEYFRLLEYLMKSLAALSAGYLVYRFTKNRLFTSLTILFFIIFSSTAGPLSHIIFIGAYLTLILICFSVIFYAQSNKNPSRIFLSSLFFFIAILACPSRAYLIVPVPLFIELFSFCRSFKIIKFLKRFFIFYFPLVVLQIIMFLNGDRPHTAFTPHLDFISRIQQITSGNLYTLSLPFQAISNLFIDVAFIQEGLKVIQLYIGLTNHLLVGFLAMNFILLILSLALGLVFRGRKFIGFAIFLISLTILMELVFYLFGIRSLHSGLIAYVSVVKGVEPFQQSLNPSIFQASLGAFYFVLGVMVGWEWWRSKNKILQVTFLAWLWSILSEFLLYLTTHWYDFLARSFERYVITCSLGVVIFMAGIFVLSIQASTKIKNIRLTPLLFILISTLILLIIWKNYKLLDNYYLTWNEFNGYSAYWQDIMYQKFLEKVGSDNLRGGMLLYIDFNQGSKDTSFNQGSFVYPARFRLFYDSNGKLIRDVCKAVSSEIDTLKNAYSLQHEQRGFLMDSICINSSSLSYVKIFYPLNNFYAYKMEDKEFYNIKADVLEKIMQNEPAVIYSVEDQLNKEVVKAKGIYPDSFFYLVKRIWEKLVSFILIFPEAEIRYEIYLLDERFSELDYVANNKIYPKMEESSKRFAFQAGILTEELIRQNNPQEKKNFVIKFNRNLELLLKLRDIFPANSAYWLLLQDDINTLQILINQLSN